MIVSSHFFGAGDALDAYLIAFLIPSFLADAFCGAIPAALIPLLMHTRKRAGPEAAAHVYRRLLYDTAALFSLLALVLIGAGHGLLRMLASGFSPDKLALSYTLLTVMAVILPLSAAANIFKSVLNMNERFAVAAGVPVVTPLLTIASLFALGNQLGIYALATGTTAGAFAEAALLAVTVYRLGMPLTPTRGSSPGARHAFTTQYAPVTVSNLVMGSSSLIDQTFAATLGSGSVSLLNFGTRLIGMVIAVGPAALSTAIFPRLSWMAARGDSKQLRRTLLISFAATAAVSVPVTAVLISLSGPLARLIFQHGAVHAADSHLIAQIQAISLVQVPFVVWLALVVRVISSLRLNPVLLKTSLLGLAVNVVLNLVLIKHLGVSGIVLSSALVHVLTLLLLAPFVFRQLREGVQSGYRDVSDVPSHDC